MQEGVSNKYTSVFKGSIFEAGSATQAPTVLLKLLYHWSCQTNIPNVVSWVKVDNRQIDEFYSLLRSVCTRLVTLVWRFSMSSNGSSLPVPCKTRLSVLEVVTRPWRLE